MERLIRACEVMAACNVVITVCWIYQLFRTLKVEHRHVSIRRLYGAWLGADGKPVKVAE